MLSQCQECNVSPVEGPDWLQIASFCLLHGTFGQSRSRSLQHPSWEAAQDRLEFTAALASIPRNHMSTHTGVCLYQKAKFLCFDYLGFLELFAEDAPRGRLAYFSYRYLGLSVKATGTCCLLFHHLQLLWGNVDPAIPGQLFITQENFPKSPGTVRRSGFGTQGWPPCHRRIKYWGRIFSTGPWLRPALSVRNLATVMSVGFQALACADDKTTDEKKKPDVARGGSAVRP